MTALQARYRRTNGAVQPGEGFPVVVVVDELLVGVVGVVVEVVFVVTVTITVIKSVLPDMSETTNVKL